MRARSVVTAECMQEAESEMHAGCRMRDAGYVVVGNMGYVGVGVMWGREGSGSES